MTLNIGSKEFLSNYMFHPLKTELSKGDRFKALISSIGLGIITLGILKEYEALEEKRNQGADAPNADYNQLQAEFNKGLVHLTDRALQT